MKRNSKKIVMITVSILTLFCLSGCHKDKPVTETEPLPTIAPETQSETISDKLDEPETLNIEEQARDLPEDMVVLGFDEDSSSTSESGASSENDSTSETDIETPLESEEIETSSSQDESVQDGNRISESEAQAILESELAEREAVQESAADWVKQNQEFESIADDYYEQQYGDLLNDPEIQRQMEELNPYKTKKE